MAEHAVILPFPARERRFQRPRAIGLLPGRLIAGLPDDDELCELLLDLPSDALSDASSSVSLPGSWKRSGHVVYWVARRTHAHPPLSPALLTGTEVELARALQALQAIGLRLHTARLLGTEGWSELHNADTALGALGHETTGISATFSTPGETLDDIELYRNGMAWAETAAQLEAVLSALAPLAADARPIELLGSRAHGELLTLAR